jgi:glycogen(starch) synthase
MANNESLKVLMFGWEFPPHISGGLGTACFGMVSGLLEAKVDVLFVVPKLFGEEDTQKFRFANASAVEVDFSSLKVKENLHRLSYLEINSRIAPYVSPEEFAQQKSFNIKETIANHSGEKVKYSFSGAYGKDLVNEVAKYSIVAMQIANDNDFDVIHAHDWLTFPAAIMAKKISGKPLVVHIHATEFDRSGENVNQEVYNMEREGVHAADKVIAVSRLTRRILINRYGVPSDKIVVVHNAVVPKEPIIYPKKNLKDKQIVTFLGRITFQKGPDYFVEAAKKVLEKMPDVHFVMAGSGDMLLPLVKRVAELKMSSRFHFTGFLNHFETNNMYGMTDIYIMPSVSEPFGITPLEAMRTGVPVIISKQSGVSEVLKNAIKIDFWDLDALTDAICGLLQHPDIAKKIASEGSKEVHNLKWEYSALKIKEIYQDTIHNFIA